MGKIGVLFNAKITAAQSLAQVLAEAIGEQGSVAWTCPAADDSRACELVRGTRMLLSLGGDGTMLRAARLAAPEAIPIVGVNMGNLGFTTELTGQEALAGIPRFLAGEGWIDERAMLQAELPARLEPAIVHALNDVVVGRGAILRVIKVKTSVDGQPVITHRGDGVIVATATGSTGYSLAAGGPVLFPNVSGMVLTPIAPHLGLNTALVLSADSVIELEVQTAHEAKASIDGQVEMALKNGDVIRIRRSPYATRLLRIQSRASFHQAILRRLSGNGESKK